MIIPTSRRRTRNALASLHEPHRFAERGAAHFHARIPGDNAGTSASLMNGWADYEEPPRRDQGGGQWRLGFPTASPTLALKCWSGLRRAALSALVASRS